ncbi:hypothetical protein CR513_16782, partial [Mucuna pruriens]
MERHESMRATTKAMRAINLPKFKGLVEFYKNDPNSNLRHVHAYGRSETLVVGSSTTHDGQRKGNILSELSKIISSRSTFLKYEEGLRHELKRVIIPMVIQEFPKLVEKENMVESLKCLHRVGKAPKNGSSRFRKGWNQKKPYNRPS